MEIANSMYVFNGYKFLDFIDVENFKKDASSIYTIPEEVQNIDFPQYYTYLMENLAKQPKDVGKIFFENILYSHLKNIFVEKISSHPNLEVNSFKKNIKHLINEININGSIPNTFNDQMSETGFYLMDVLNITIPNSTFIAGLDYTESNGIVTNARFLFVEVVPQGTKGPAYFIAGIELDFQNKIALTMVRNVLGLTKEDSNTSTTIHQIHKQASLELLKILGVSLQKPVVKDDRLGMYKFCKELDDRLLKDIRENLHSQTDNTVKDSVKKLNNALFNKTDNLKATDKRDLRKKISSLLLSYYIEYKIEPLALVKKAKKDKLVGYPTRINFTSSKSGRSSTQSSNAKYPVSASDMFHSLYFNFEQALGLDNWSISWFTDYNFIDETDIDVIQTTIYSTSNQFRIVFLAGRPLNKEVIHYVIRTVNSYREQQATHK
ncbi:hypothetical protein BWGOE3_03300 [Bacillus mycoides]|uniref:hypothetical protein n=1 Tax=Bacillus mycoides TaxID=1405 RepID=UPI000871E3B5|nr:hypothetical protein [Bacillus mycoides]OFD52332.1 hypothetical protein BWGOE3_03300 [Bacillus mycoides]